jgi:beta-galactosidase
VTFDHQARKDPFYFYKANWSAEPVTYITGRRYTHRAYPIADVKVYSNADSVTLSVNGAPVGAMTSAQCEQRTRIFRRVRLSPGPNTLVAAGNHVGNPVSDSVQWSLNGMDINIAAGRLTTGYVSSNGTRFGSDHFFVGGTGAYIELGEDARGGDPDVSGTDDPQLYKYLRRGDFRYAISVAAGRYEVTLGFVEPDRDTDVGDRVFSVTANGQRLLENFDVLREAGDHRRVITRTFTVNVSGGQLTLDFTAAEGEALVSTIKIIRSNGTPTP